jgi:nicotinamide mononucleotide transporter
MQTSLLEVAADITGLVSVILTVFLRKSLYPVGILSTLLFFFLYWNAKLYASAGLQVYYTLIQFYGWWFWLRGDHGHEPPVDDWPWRKIVVPAIVAGLFTAGVSVALYRFTDARAPVLDTAIFAASVLAQFLLDRKQLKNWLIWGLVDVLSIAVYSGQKLWLTTGLYAILLANTAIGWLAWRRARARQAA